MVGYLSQEFSLNPKLTVEEIIFQRALRKLQLSNAIIEEGFLILIEM